MTGFKDVKLSWQGVEYSVPADRQMGLIHIIEEALSGDSGRQAIGVLLAKEGPSYGKLASAYSAALQYAGAPVTFEAVYLSIMDDIADGEGDLTIKLQGCVLGLLSIIAPPLWAKMTGNDTGKK